MSNLSKLSAWQIIGAYTLRSAVGAEEELVALDALSVAATAMGLEPEGTMLRFHAQEVRRVAAMHGELRDYFDGQLKLPLEGDGKDGKDGNGQ